MMDPAMVTNTEPGVVENQPELVEVSTEVLSVHIPAWQLV
jgi:hypothetical protein